MEYLTLVDPERFKRQFSMWDEEHKKDIEAAIDEETKINAIDLDRVEKRCNDDWDAARLGLRIFIANWCKDVTAANIGKDVYRCRICPFHNDSGTCLINKLSSSIYNGGGA